MFTHSVMANFKKKKCVFNYKRHSLNSKPTGWSYGRRVALESSFRQEYKKTLKDKGFF